MVRRPGRRSADPRRLARAPRRFAEEMADVGDAAAPTGLITLEDFLRRAHLASGREWPPPRHRPPPSPAHPPPAPPDTAYVLHCRTVPLVSPLASPFFAVPLDGGGCVVADYGHDRLSVFCPRGSILRRIPCARPLGMALGDEAMHVAGADGLASLDLEGGVIRKVGGACESENGSASGDASEAAGAPLLSRACGVAIDSAGAREPVHGLHRTPLPLASWRRVLTHAADPIPRRKHLRVRLGAPPRRRLQPDRRLRSRLWEWARRRVRRAR